MNQSTIITEEVAVASCSKRRDEFHNSDSIDLFAPRDNKQMRENTRTRSLEENSSLTEDDANSLAGAGKAGAAGPHHHVGPVMGIFFKVWSFVKVTKDKHHHQHHHQSNNQHQQNTDQKMRRQNSADETGQFQYISGAELNEHKHQRSSAPALQDHRHFRRAGSQPVTGAGNNHSSAASAAAATPTNHLSNLKHHQSLRDSAGSNRLQVAGLTRTGTSSTTSSGASSASGGSQFNFNAHNQLHSPASPAGKSATPPKAASNTASSVRRHLSAYSLRRSTAEVGSIQQQQQQQQEQRQLSKLAQNSQQVGGKQSWASKIKRSATTVNQTDFSSYVSRYRFRRDHPIPGATSVERGSADQKQSQNQQQVNSTSDRQPASSFLFSQNLDKSTKNTNGHREETPTLEADEGDEIGGYRLTIAGDEQGDEDADSNDIYSTPNDSIQSVPSGQPLVQWQPHVDMPPNRAPNNMRSSSSTGNFAQLVQQQKPSQNFITSNRSHADKSSPPSIKQINGQPKHDATSSRRVNSSHFFISSSSSEDSNTGVYLHQGNNKVAINPTGSTGWHKPDQRQVTIQQGVHYHHQRPAIRPNSLQMVEEDATYSIPSQFTPTTNAAVSSDIVQKARLPPSGLQATNGYRKSPSMQEFMGMVPRRLTSETTSKFPRAAVVVAPKIEPQTHSHISNSISLNDFNLAAAARGAMNKNLVSNNKKHENQVRLVSDQSEYRLAKMLLESNLTGATPTQRDQDGYTALMLAVLSENSAIVRCLLDHKVDPNDTNLIGQSALDLLCTKAPSRERLGMFKLLIDNGANPDLKSKFDNMRLLDRLISEHLPHASDDEDKLPYIDFLLQNGAKLGSTTWQESRGKQDIQMRLLKKLCQDGYFLYKVSSIEQAVYRFEYALMRAAELDKQLLQSAHLHQHATGRRPASSILFLQPYQEQNSQLFGSLQPNEETRQIKYQAYLGLSRCERKRKFYRRALEFADLAILLESTSYEGYYSKAHILKDLGDTDEALKAIEQTERLVDFSIERMEAEQRDLKQQAEEALVLDGRMAIFNTSGDLDGSAAIDWINSRQMEVCGTLDYLNGARCFVTKMKGEIMEIMNHQDKSVGGNALISNPIAT